MSVAFFLFPKEKIIHFLSKSITIVYHRVTHLFISNTSCLILIRVLYIKFIILQLKRLLSFISSSRENKKLCNSNESLLPLSYYCIQFYSVPFKTVSIQAMIKCSSQLGDSMLHMVVGKNVCQFHILFSSIYSHFYNSIHRYSLFCFFFLNKIVKKWKMVSGKKD